MKAFKQINLNFEKRVVFSYAAILCLVCSFIVLNPLFGQDDGQNLNKPEIKIDVQTEYDEDGNIIGYDSSYSWYWSDKDLSSLDFDSLFDHFHLDINNWHDCDKRKQFNPFSQLQLPGQKWDHFDTSFYSDMNNYFDGKFSEHFNFDNWDFNFNDSTIISYFDDFHDQFNFDEYFEKNDYFEKFNDDNEEFMDRIRKYQEEHQKLIEKYFREPFDEMEDDAKIDQNKYSPKKKNVKTVNTGRI